MANERPFILWRLCCFGGLLVGRGWDMAAFWIATVYSIYAALFSVDFQSSVLRAIHVDPDKRLAIWGFGLAAFFLYAGFRAWDDGQKVIERLSVPDELAAAIRAQTSEMKSQALRQSLRDFVHNWVETDQK
jgi:hypothetical protein